LKKWEEDEEKGTKKMVSLLFSFCKGHGLSLKEERRIFVLIKLQKYSY
jgi:hypothetical protein